MKQAIGYIRVSTDRQAKEGVSLDSQRDMIQSWCERNGYELEQVYVDAGVSGKRMKNREGLQNALKSMRKDTVLVAYSISRLARSLPDMLSICREIDRKGGDLVSLTEKIDTISPSGRMMFSMLAAFAQYESEIIGERTSTAMQHKRAKGERYCNVTPFGFKEVNGRLQEVDKEMRVIQGIIKQRSQGMSLRAIAETLTSEGIATKRGGTWQANTVSKLIQRYGGMNAS
jgi:site-specific DNA recombinase